MKLDALQITALVLIVVGSALDMATTEVLLSIGSVRVGDNIVSFSEANPLFYALGHEGFRALYVLITAALLALVLLAPRIIPRDKSLYQVALMVLACYGLAHLALGLRNYMILRAYVS